MARLILIGKPLAPATAALRGPPWEQAAGGWIARAVSASEARPAGGWFALDASDRIGRRPRRFVVAGHPLVVFRERDGGVVAGPDTCPHLGACLSDGRVERDAIVCPWHGMRLRSGAHPRWRAVPTHDDGVLVWVRLDDAGEPPDDRPSLPARPPRFVAGVVRVEAACDPCDVLANRFDPWHGPHLHPYAFARLEVLERGQAHALVRVTKRVVGPIAVEVDARFDSPDRRTIVMTIVAGEGEGSVVETHATPITPGRTAIVEAALATSGRIGLLVMCRLASLVRFLLERAARRLWVDDGAYAERLFRLRASREG